MYEEFFHYKSGVNYHVYGGVGGVTQSRYSDGGLRAAWTTGCVQTHGGTNGLCKATLRLSRVTVVLTIIFMLAVQRQTVILFELRFKYIFKLIIYKRVLIQVNYF